MEEITSDTIVDLICKQTFDSNEFEEAYASNAKPLSPYIDPGPASIEGIYSFGKNGKYGAEAALAKILGDEAKTYGREIVIIGKVLCGCDILFDEGPVKNNEVRLAKKKAIQEIEDAFEKVKKALRELGYYCK